MGRLCFPEGAGVRILALIFGIPLLMVLLAEVFLAVRTGS